MVLEKNDLDEILENKLIQLVLKELVSKNGFLYDKSVIFVKAWKFDKDYFLKFLNWLYYGLDKWWNFVISYKDISDLKDQIQQSLESKHINRKLYLFFENISDYLELELSRKWKSILNDKDKIIAKEGIQKYLLNTIKDIDIIEELMKILSK